MCQHFTTMKGCVFALLLMLALTGISAYTSKYDNFDVDQVLKNERLLRRYHECLVSNSDVSCTGEAKQLKNALNTDCSQCSEKQKSVAEKVIRFLIRNKPHLWQSLQQKYDPAGTCRQRHDAQLKKLSA